MNEIPHGQDDGPISPETARKFIDGVITTFANFYTGSDVQEQVDELRSFGDDPTAVINYAYGALKAANLDLVEFRSCE